MVKRSKLQKLTSDFENMKMHEHETIYEFISRILTMVNDFLLLDNLFLRKKFAKKS